MRLAGRDGVSVTLRPVDYQFGSTGDPHDDNWLMVEGQIETPDRSWSFRDPCLTVTEAGEVGGWLAMAGRGLAPVSGPDAHGDLCPDDLFTEPNLGFSVEAYEGDEVTVRVHLSLEASPPPIAGEPRPDVYEFFVRCTLPRRELLVASEQWTTEAAGFPERSPRPTSPGRLRRWVQK